MRTFLALSLAFLCSLAIGPVRAAASNESPLGPEVRQLLVSVAPGWDVSNGGMIGFERGSDGVWKQSFGPVPVLFGRHGLAWGRGVLGTDESGAHKVEHDGRAPAGVFKIGKIYTYD